MHSTRVTRILPYRPDQLFDLIADVESYPQFLPWVGTLRTWNRTESQDGVRSLDAEAKVGFAIVRETFATRVKMDERARRIEVGLLYGPFKHLKNVWRFEPVEGGTKIDFEIDFAFKSRLLDALLAANLRYAADRLIACFEGRAKKLYGARGPGDPALAAGGPA